MRKLPDIPLSPCLPDYARITGHGWDSIQEAYAFKPTQWLLDLLEVAQTKAREIDESEGIVVAEIAGQRFKVYATGAKRYRYRFGNDDFLILVSIASHEWSFSVRFLSGGLWEHGWRQLRERVIVFLRHIGVQQLRDCVRVSRADYCFDFYSPALTRELVPATVLNVIAHSSVKKFELMTVTAGKRTQTTTVGTRASLQWQIYDKSREITEQSGKTWLYDLWRETLGFDPWGANPVADVWRLEVRFFSQYLKDRNCRRPHELETQREHLIGEALMTRRLVVPQGNDSNSRRWPLHPIFSEAFRLRGATEMLPLGRKVTGRRDALGASATKQISGLIRSATILAMGEYNPETARAISQRALGQIAADPSHRRKIVAAQDRYSDVDEAR